MKKIFLTVLPLLFFLAACGAPDQPSEEPSDGEKAYTVTLLAPAGVTLPLTAQLCDENGLSVGKTELSRGKNTLPAQETTYYLSCDLPEMYDCPVVRLDGDVTLTVKEAFLSETEGTYEHTFTVFLSGGEGEYQLQMCKTGETEFCKIAYFSGGAATLALTDGKYSVEVRKGSEIAMETEFNFSYTATPRYLIVELKGGSV